MPEGSEDIAATVNVSELICGGLVQVEGGRPISTTDQLDTEFLLGFLESAALAAAEKHIRKTNENAQINLPGQELNAESYAICRASNCFWLALLLES